MSLIFFITFIFTLCVLPTQASWYPLISFHNIVRSESRTSHKGVGTTPEEVPSLSPNTTTPYIPSLPSASIIVPTSTSQGMLVASIIPIYEVCDTPGKSTTSCSTVFETVTTESCSTVLTYAFTKTTISECVHNITFSSRTTYALATTTLSVGADVQGRDVASTNPSPTPVTYVQSTVSLYAAPWQSLAADTVGGITVSICTSDYTGTQSCVLIEEIWVVHTEFVPVMTTSTLSISTSFTSDVILLLAPTQSVLAPVGHFTLSTLIESSSMSPNATTSTVVPTASHDAIGIEAGTENVVPVDPRTSSTILTKTVTVTGDASTVTRALSLVGEGVVPSMVVGVAEATGSVEPTTTLKSTTTLTRTVTVLPSPSP